MQNLRDAAAVALAVGLGCAVVSGPVAVGDGTLPDDVLVETTRLVWNIDPIGQDPKEHQIFFATAKCAIRMLSAERPIIHMAGNAIPSSTISPKNRMGDLEVHMYNLNVGCSECTRPTNRIQYCHNASTRHRPNYTLTFRYPKTSERGDRRNISVHINSSSSRLVTEP